MKKILLLLSALFLVSRADAQMAAWNFNGDNGATNTNRSASIFNFNLDSSSLLTRGAGAAASTGTNSFRTTGFSNNGIAVTNTDYFQFTLSASSGYTLSLNTIDAFMAGTASYATNNGNAGVANQFAYSLDGSSFSLIGSALVLTNTSLALPQISLTNINDLQNVSAGTTLTFRFYASGQSGTGGWGFNSPNSGQNGLAIGGTLNPLVGAQLYWSGGTWSTNGPGTGGGGTWQNGVGSWDPASQAVFGGTAGSVEASGTVTTSNGLAFVTSGYDVSGGFISLAGATAGANSLDVTNAAAATISSVLSGSAGFTKNGGGTLVVAGVNTFSGNVSVANGTLQIATDSALGNAANDLVLNGTLRTTNSISLGSGRDLSGSATLDIAGASTLTVIGAFSASATTLANSGTLDLQGSTRSAGALAINAPATLQAAGAVSVSSLSASGLTNGTATIKSAIVYSSAGDKTLDVGAGGNLNLGATISGTTGRIAKTGAGTLSLADNTTGGLRVGASGSSPTQGGTVILQNNNSAGSGQIQLNYGTLKTDATAGIVATNGFSIGGRTGAVAVFGGANDMSFSGTNSFFRGTGTSGEFRIDANNKTTLSGPWSATSGTGTATGITIGGTGVLALSGNGSLLTETITLTDTATLALDGSLGGSVAVNSGATLGGDGSIAGSLSLLAGAKFTFDLNKTLSVNGATVSFGSFGVNNLVGLDSSVASGTYKLIDGTATFNTANLNNLGAANAYDLGGGKSAYFSIGSLDVNVVPEPSTYAMLAMAGIGFAGYVVRRRRR
jgi:autotransporter-associated beta strand protein